MANTLNVGNGNWGVKKDSLLAYNSENGNFKPLPFDFTRASSATVVNKAGLIETVGSGEPRIDFLGNTKGALKLEPQRTNLNTYSDPTDAQKGSTSYASVTYQDNYNWGLGNVINNAIVFGDNSTTRYAYYNSSVTSGTEYTLSAFIKMDDNSVPVPLTDFLMVLAGTSFASGYSVESYGNNIYRVSVSGTAGASNTANGTLKVASHSTKGFKLSAFQLEQASYATSYIPTSGQSGGVTRVADVCNNGANEQVINSTEGVLYYEVSAQDNSITTSILSISNGSNANSLYSGFSSTSNTIQAQLVVGGVAQTNMNYVVSDRTEFNKVAILYQNNNHKMYVNGVQASVDTSGSVPSANTFDRLNFDLGQGSFDFYGNVKDVRLYNTALTDSELQQLTTI